jgi:RimJ/RimL family protein N-acetyltransferase
MRPRRATAPARPSAAPSAVLPLVTQRLLLRDFVAADVVALEALARDPRLLEHVAPPTRALAAALRAPAGGGNRPRPRRRAFDLAVVLRRGGRLVGACDLAITGPRQADFGYLLGARHWGHGYGTELAAALVEFAFRALALRRLTALVAVENERSRRVLAKAGLEWEGMVRRHVRYGGRWHDCHRYVIERERWEATRRCDAATARARP